MKERALIFHADDIPNLVNGSQTQTLLPVRPQPQPELRGHSPRLMYLRTYRDDRLCVAHGSWYDPYMCCHLVTGDTIWVREPFRLLDFSYSYEYGWECEGIRTGSIPKQKPSILHHDHLGWEYLADTGKDDEPWHPASHMPRWLARIFLTVTQVTLARTLELTDANIDEQGYNERAYNHREKISGLEARTCCAAHWDKSYPKFPWNSNPYIFVVSFELDRARTDPHVLKRYSKEEASCPESTLSFA